MKSIFSQNEKRVVRNPVAKKVPPKRWAFHIHQATFLILLLVVLLLASANIAKAKGFFIPEQPAPLVQDGIIAIQDLTLEQKLAQMVIVAGSTWNLQPIRNMQVGGIHLFALGQEELFPGAIQQFQAGMAIPFFVTVDLEGCLNPFAAFRLFLPASEVETVGEAFEKGAEEGKYLRSLGVTINFAPVVDLDDEIWKCRSFPGDASQIGALAEAYILGLQNEKIMATAKHYPGKTLVARDPHKFLVTATVGASDLVPYQEVADTAQGIMVSHIIVDGALDSQGLPSVVSPGIIQGLPEQFSGLVITDEINMLGLRSFYPTLDEMYIAVLQAGSDIILNFNDDPNEIYRMIQIWKEAVDSGLVSEERIDASVRKILEAKGLQVVG